MSQYNYTDVMDDWRANTVFFPCIANVGNEGFKRGGPVSSDGLSTTSTT